MHSAFYGFKLLCFLQIGYASVYTVSEIRANFFQENKNKSFQRPLVQLQCSTNPHDIAIIYTSKDIPKLATYVITNST